MCHKNIDFFKPIRLEKLTLMNSLVKMRLCEISQAEILEKQKMIGCRAESRDNCSCERKSDTFLEKKIAIHSF